MRKYQKTLWVVVSGFVIISFVIYFSPQSKLGMGRGGGDVSLGTIDGQPISRDDYMQARMEAAIRYRLYYGTWPDSDSSARSLGYDADQETASRLLMLHEIKKQGIHAGEASMAEWISNTFRDKNKTFVPENYEQFITREMIPHGVSKADFQEFVAHEIGIQHMVSLSGLTGKLITPRDAEAVYRRQNEQYLTEAVFFSASNHVASVTVTPAALSQYYSNNIGNYRIFERLQVDYIQVAANGFLNAASQKMTNDPAFLPTVDKIYQQRGTNAFTDDKGVPNNELQAKEKIKSELQSQLAKNLARQQANTFVEALGTEASSPEAFTKLATARGYTVKTSQPFDETGPQDMLDSKAIANAAMRLTSEEPYSAVVMGADSVYVLCFKKRLPSEIQPFEQVREKVTTDYRNSEALKAARKAGADFQTTLNAEVGKGKTFADACAAAKVTPLQIPPFARSTRALPEVESKAPLSQFKDVTFNLAPGKASNFTSSREGGFVVHLKSVLPVDDAKMKAELPDFEKTMQRSAQYEAFNEWFRKEMQKVNLAVGKKKGTAN